MLSLATTAKMGTSTSGGPALFANACVLVIAILLCLTAFAQSRSNLLVEFKVATSNEKLVTDALILIEPKGQRTDTISCSDQCQLALDLDQLYKVSVLKPGFPKAVLLFDTRSVAGESRERNFEFSELKIVLEPRIRSKKPALQQVIVYGKEIDNFYALKLEAGTKSQQYYQRILSRDFGTPSVARLQIRVQKPEGQSLKDLVFIVSYPDQKSDSVRLKNNESHFDRVFELDNVYHIQVFLPECKAKTVVLSTLNVPQEREQYYDASEILVALFPIDTPKAIHNTGLGVYYDPELKNFNTRALPTEESTFGFYYFHSGVWLQQMGKQVPAMQQLLLAERLDPENPNLYRALIDLCLAMDETEKACEYAIKADSFGYKEVKSEFSGVCN